MKLFILSEKYKNLTVDLGHFIPRYYIVKWPSLSVWSYQRWRHWLALKLNQSHESWLKMRISQPFQRCSAYTEYD